MAVFAGTAGAQVLLRGQPEALRGDVTGASAAGLLVTVGGVAKTVSWDRVREVHGEKGAEAAKHLEAVRDLWRARMRLERGDFAAAEPMLDALAERERTVVGPTAAVVFEGLLRCRLKRGATLPAVWAWLEWSRARSGLIRAERGVSAAWVGGTIDAPAVLERGSGLIAGVPPLFLRDAALDAAAASDEWVRFGAADETTKTLAALYRSAARFEAGLPPELGTLAPQISDESVRLVAEVVAARVGDDKEREQARGALRTRLEQREIEPWLECWCRVGMGRSLVREQDSEVVRQGVIQLLHAPSRFARVSPYAAAVALAEAAVVVHDLGDEQGAAALKAELMDRFPRSVAAGWIRLRDIKPPPEPRRAGPRQEPAKDAPSPGATPEGSGG